MDLVSMRLMLFVDNLDTNWELNRYAQHEPHLSQGNVYWGFTIDVRQAWMIHTASLSHSKMSIETPIFKGDSRAGSYLKRYQGRK